MKIVSRAWVLLGGLLLAATAEAALTLSVDRNPVALDESFTLTLSSDESLDGEPDFGWIDRELEVVSRQQSSNIQMINGDVSRSITWIMTVLPKQHGIIAIPPVKVGERESNALTLQVNERAEDDAEQLGAVERDGLLLQVEAGEGELYVQQQLLYTIKLLVAQDGGMSVGNGSSLSEPELEEGDAVIKRLGEDSNYQTVRNGKRYTVIERRYAIYPQQSGPLTIKPVLFTGQMVAVQSRSRSIFDTLQQRSQIKRVVSTAVQRQVRAIPPDFSGSNWLPAKNVQLVEQWPGQQQSMVAGEPVTRTVALMVDGLTGAQLPVLAQNYPAELKSYPDQPLLKETPSAQGITALRQEKIALLASAPGTLTLPAMEVPWWNTATDREEIARLPARQVTVVAAAGSTAPPPAVIAPAPLPPAPLAQAAATSNSVPVAAARAGWQQDARWPVAALALAAAWLVTLLLWWRSARARPARPAAKSPASEGKKALEKKLKLACSAHQAGAAKESLLQWGRLQWPESGPVSLGDLARRAGGELADAVNELSHTLYAAGENEWRGERLWQAFKRWPHGEGGNREQRSGLEPLFRHQPSQSALEKTV
jgi:hypothetical protein